MKRPWSAEEVKRYLAERARHYAKNGVTYSDPNGKRKGAMVGKLNEIFGNNINRKAAIKWLTTKGSTRKWKDCAWLAFRDWLNVQKIDGEWVVGQYVRQEANNVIVRAQKAQGQQKLF